MATQKTGGVVWTVAHGDTTDTVIAVVSEDGSTLDIVVNISIPMLWGYVSVPLSMDGNAHKVVLNAATNTNMTEYSMDMTINDGTLEYSAIVEKGVGLIDFVLNVPSGDGTIKINGNGIYAVSEIEVNYLTVANSAQNEMSSIISSAVNVALVAFNAYTGDVPGAVTNAAAAVGDIVGTHPTYNTSTATTESASMVNEIATTGFNAYIKKQAAAAAAKGNTYGATTASSNPNATGSSSFLSSGVMIGALGLILLLILFVAKG